jgi:hypothetical protein
MANKLLVENGAESQFNMELFSSMNNDPNLISEIVVQASNPEE